MDIVIPLCATSHRDNIELRYCLRSIEKHLSGIGNIYIMGTKPQWAVNVIEVQATDKPGSENKAENIYNKILLACSNGLSEEFIHMHDDHFIIKPIAANEFPYHHKGIINIENRNCSDSYLMTIRNTMKLLPGAINFNVHSPIRYLKKNFPLPYVYPRYGYLLKTLYCNTYGIEGTYAPDCKIKDKKSATQIKELINNRLYFSIGDGAFSGEIIKVLDELYPEKSKYEL